MTTKYIEKLSHQDWQIRLKIVEELVADNSPELLAFLTGNLHHPDSNVRNGIKTILIDKKNSSLIISELNNPDPHIRIAVINILGKIGDINSLSSLLFLYQTEKEKKVRLSLIESFYYFRLDDIIKHLLTDFDSKDDEEKLTILHLLKNSKENYFLELIYKYLYHPLLCPAIIQLIGENGNSDALEYLMDFCFDKNPYYFELSCIGIDKILEREHNSVVKFNKLVQRYDKSKQDQLIKRIVDYLSNKKEYSKTALTLLNHIDYRASFPYIVRLHDKNEQKVLQILQEIAKTDSVFLLSNLQNSDLKAKGLIYYAVLARGSCPSAEQVLALLAFERNIQILELSLQGLIERENEDIISAFLVFLNQFIPQTDYYSIWNEAQIILLSIQNNQIKNWAITLLSLSNSFQIFSMQFLSKSKFDLLVSEIEVVLKSTDNNLRKLIPSALRNSTDPSAIKVIKKLSRDKNNEIRLHTAAALKDIKSDESVNILKKMQNDVDAEVAAVAILSLAYLGFDGDIDTWVQYLKVPIDDISRSVIQALLILKTETSKQVLRSYLELLKKSDITTAQFIETRI
ncbi:MAG TPA: HEAT repeat domain-containing protein [Ignavibacteriaceae bacterium]|nr:HEAT repeat domain-containing protein [Ignavibacteriaceae bacterium]